MGQHHLRVWLENANGLSASQDRKSAKDPGPFLEAFLPVRSHTHIHPPPHTHTYTYTHANTHTYKLTHLKHSHRYSQLAENAVAILKDIAVLAGLPTTDAIAQIVVAMHTLEVAKRTELLHGSKATFRKGASPRSMAVNKGDECDWAKHVSEFAEGGVMNARDSIFGCANKSALFKSLHADACRTKDS